MTPTARSPHGFVPMANLRFRRPASCCRAISTLPAGARGLVIFAHGSGSSRLSPRNRYRGPSGSSDGGLGTLLFDLLTGGEEALDASRAASLRHRPSWPAGWPRPRDWVRDATADADAALGYFGASTGAAAALVAAARHPGLRRRDRLPRRPPGPGRGVPPSRSTAPTLLIVGGADSTVIRLNQAALAQLSCDVKELKIVPAATHLFEEPGALEQVADLAGQWFARHLQPERTR